MAHPVAQTVRMRLVYLGDGNVNVETVVEFFFYVMWLEDDKDSKYIKYLLKKNNICLHIFEDRIDLFLAGKYPVF